MHSNHTQAPKAAPAWRRCHVAAHRFPCPPPPRYPACFQTSPFPPRPLPSPRLFFVPSPPLLPLPVPPLPVPLPFSRTALRTAQGSIATAPARPERRRGASGVSAGRSSALGEALWPEYKLLWRSLCSSVGFRQRQRVRRDECGLAWRKSAQKSPVLCAGEEGGVGSLWSEVSSTEGLRRRIFSAVTWGQARSDKPPSKIILYRAAKSAPLSS